jgi:histidinol-phosphate/aromatic aminotransferase/cobyric acid decarboxylase-like protein
VHPCGDFPGLSSTFIRVAVRAVDENRLLVQKLAEVIDGR